MDVIPLLLIVVMVLVLLQRQRRLQDSLDALARRWAEPPGGAPSGDPAEALAGTVAPLAERLDALEASLARLREEIAAIRKGDGERDGAATSALGRVREELSAAVQAQARMEEALRDLERRLAAVAPAPDEQLRARVVAALLEHGCHSPRVLAAPPEAAARGRHRVPVEAVRGGVRVRGAVLLEDGAVTAVQLDPDYQAFP